MAEAEDLVKHLEATLGLIQAGSSWNLDGGLGRVQVARFHDQPGKGLTSFVTLGLSHHVVVLDSGREVRVELIASCWDRDAAAGLPAVLAVVARGILESHRAPSYGEVLGPAGPLFDDLPALTALYCAEPVYFSEQFATWAGSSPATVFVQLLPVTDAEAHLVRHEGWRAFEAYLNRSDPDVFDLQRSDASD